MKLGMNLRGSDKAQEDCKRSNLFIDIGGWAADSSGMPIPQSSFTPPDFTAPGATPSVPCSTHPATWGWVAGGDYTIRAAGKGTVTFGKAFNFTGAPDQAFVWPIPNPPWTYSESTFLVNKVDPADPLRDLRMIGPLGDDTSFFTPSYLESLRGFEVIRAMDWMIGVASAPNPYNRPPNGPMGAAAEISDWSQVDLRPGRGLRGLCDLLLALKKVHGKAPDLWINLPYRCATGTSATSAAANELPEAYGHYLASRLPPDVEVYVEYANEPWNYALYNNYLVDQFQAFKIPRYAGYGLLSAACWDAFERGFGRNCARVLNGQYVWPENNLVNALDALKATGKRVDAIASAPYWWMGDGYGPALVAPVKAAWAAGDRPGALTQLFALLHNGIADAVKHLANWKSIASKYGVRNVCYEGGTGPDKGITGDKDLNATWEAAMEDPRLATEVGAYLDAISPYADLFCWFMLCGIQPWGAARNAGDWGNARMTGLRQYMGLGPMDPFAKYPSDGYGSTGAGFPAPAVSPPPPPPPPPPDPVKPAITWPAPAPIVQGEALSDAQLNATADVPGTFAYSPPAGTVPKAGELILFADFTPDDPARYTTATAGVPLIVTTPPPPPQPPPVAGWSGTITVKDGRITGITPG